jgi:hypothetical protein
VRTENIGDRSWWSTRRTEGLMIRCSSSSQRDRRDSTLARRLDRH